MADSEAASNTRGNNDQNSVVEIEICPQCSESVNEVGILCKGCVTWWGGGGRQRPVMSSNVQ